MSLGLHCKGELNGSAAPLKAKLVAKDYSQPYVNDYLETFSHVAKMTSVRLFIFLGISYYWALHQFLWRMIFAMVI